MVVRKGVHRTQLLWRLAAKIATAIVSVIFRIRLRDKAPFMLHFIRCIASLELKDFYLVYFIDLLVVLR